MNTLRENAVVYYTNMPSDAPAARDGTPRSPPFKHHTDVQREVQRSISFGEPYAIHESEQIYGITNPDGTVVGAAKAYFESLTDVLDKRLVYFSRQYLVAEQRYDPKIEFQTLAHEGSNWDELPETCDTTFFKSF
eukprot:TRINITY_DN6899_c0_g1_i5.p1 TRINITY_DN6899_c0_g1~~TRINITY_DN6899_c0_g1_i5.p1  ORF type:complete len:135 (-),score=35.80 TRINITY_DN6899_c0_g1_i5:130-534(-)